MGKPRMKLYLDPVSTFGYLGYYFVRHSNVFKSVEVEFVPITIGGLMHKCQNKTPILITNKDKWINRERLGWAKQFDIPMRQDMPPSFPPKSMNVQRFLMAVWLKAPSKFLGVFDRICASFWAPHTLPSSLPKPSASPTEYDMNLVDDLRILLADESILGEKLTNECIEAMSTADVKGALRKTTDDAFDDGAFGLPWYKCTNVEGETAGFWGFDHLGVVTRFLGLDDLEKHGGSPLMKPLL